MPAVDNSYTQNRASLIWTELGRLAAPHRKVLTLHRIKEFIVSFSLLQAPH